MAKTQPAQPAQEKKRGAPMAEKTCPSCGKTSLVPAPTRKCPVEGCGGVFPSKEKPAASVPAAPVAAPQASPSGFGLLMELAELVEREGLESVQTALKTVEIIRGKK